MTWIFFWIIVYLILILVLSLRHVKTTDMESYLVNNRKTKTFPLVATTLATFVGGGTSMGLMAMGYESGLAAVGIGVAYVMECKTVIFSWVCFLVYFVIVKYLLYT